MAATSTPSWHGLSSAKQREWVVPHTSCGTTSKAPSDASPTSSSSPHYTPPLPPHTSSHSSLTSTLTHSPHSSQTPSPLSTRNLLGLLAKIKCSICSFQRDRVCVSQDL
eukprot:GHVN01087440.1.p2 GENE.GHVN01087440.1~~GHVN01087440.1.p2  ORF type:complete len:109 (-),score=18.37 GHVN01087440.1:285-611(-)